MKAILALEDGSVFHGEGFGARASACGEVCFNTSMTGYQEILTDPSYKGPDRHDDLSADRQLRRQPCRTSNRGGRTWPVSSFANSRRWSATGARILRWREYLEQNGIPGIQGMDTRALTKKLRVRGALNGFISTEGICRR